MNSGDKDKEYKKLIGQISDAIRSVSNDIQNCLTQDEKQEIWADLAEQEIPFEELPSYLDENSEEIQIRFNKKFVSRASANKDAARIVMAAEKAKWGYGQMQELPELVVTRISQGGNIDEIIDGIRPSNEYSGKLGRTEKAPMPASNIAGFDTIVASQRDTISPKHHNPRFD